MTRLRLGDVLDLVPEAPEPDRMFLVRISPAVLAALMQTRWIPENNPDYRVKVAGVNERQDGFSDLIIVGENA